MSIKFPSGIVLEWDLGRWYVHLPAIVSIEKASELAKDLSDALIFAKIRPTDG